MVLVFCSTTWGHWARRWKIALLSAVRRQNPSQSHVDYPHSRLTGQRWVAALFFQMRGCPSDRVMAYRLPVAGAEGPEGSVTHPPQPCTPCPRTLFTSLQPPWALAVGAAAPQGLLLMGGWLSHKSFMLE